MLLRLPQDKDARLAILLVGTAAAMAALSFASVPLYRLFCQVTGIEGTTRRAAEAPRQILARRMTVRFDANTDPGLPWSFKASQLSQEGRIGEPMLASYHVENLSDEPVTGRAVFNVEPEEAGRYFSKIQCFCFTLQTLKPGEKIDMPLTYFVDPKIAEDHRLDELSTITLSYTFYRQDGAKVDK